MALTLSEGNKYSLNTLAGYVIDLFAKGEDVMEKLPFVEVIGNAYQYNMKATRSTAKFYAVGDTWDEDTLTITPATANLVILGGDADIDNFLKATRSNIIDLKGEVLQDKVLATREKFLDTFFYGNDSSNVKEFDGLQVLISSTTYNTVHAGSSTGTALSMAKLQEAIDLVTSPISSLLMSKKMRRLINTYLDTVGDKFITERDQFGKMIEYYRGLPISINDHITDTETASSGAYAAATGGANTTIFIVRYDSKAVCGLQGPNQIETVPLGNLETKDAERYRIRWYCGLKFEDLRSSAKVDGIATGSAVTA